MQLVIAVDGWTESNRPIRICEGLTRANPTHAPGVHGSPSRYRLLTGATRTDRRGGGCEKPLPQSSGVLSPGPNPQLHCRNLGFRLASFTGCFSEPCSSRRFKPCTNNHPQSGGYLPCPGVVQWKPSGGLSGALVSGKAVSWVRVDVGPCFM